MALCNFSYVTSSLLRTLTEKLHKIICFSLAILLHFDSRIETFNVISEIEGLSSTNCYGSPWELL